MLAIKILTNVRLLSTVRTSLITVLNQVSNRLLVGGYVHKHHGITVQVSRSMNQVLTTSM